MKKYLIILAVLMAFAPVMAQTSFYYLVNGSAGDGRVGYNGTAASGCAAAQWNTARSAVSGTEVSYTSATVLPFAGTGCMTDTSVRLQRGFVTFNTTPIPENAVIQWGFIGVFVHAKSNSIDDGNDFIVFTQGTQPSTSVLTTADYSRLGTTELTLRKDITSIAALSYPIFNLTAAGIASINSTGSSYFAIREGHDLLNTWPSYAAGQYNYIGAYQNESGAVTIVLYANYTLDTTPPVISNGAPTGSLAYTTSTTISVTTDEAATCRYTTLPGVAYASMPNTFSTTGGTSHSTLVSGLSAQTWIFYVKCIDTKTNANPADYTITFTILPPPDTTPPVISSGLPAGSIPYTNSVTMSAATNESATCRYATSPGISYASMTNTFSTTGGTSHSTNVTGLTNQTYNYYVRCIDTSANANPADYTITFTILPPADVTPPVLSLGAPSGSISYTNSVIMSALSNEPATCKYSTTPGQSYASMPNTFTTTGGTSQYVNVTGLTNQAYNYYVRCIDTSANANTADYAITFTILPPADVTPPVMSNPQPTGSLPLGTNSAIISLATNEAATCKYSGTSGQAYASMPNTFTTTGGISHSSNVTGLSDGNNYTFYAKCRDASNNTNGADLVINFAVLADITPPVLSNGQPSGVLPSGTTNSNLNLTTNEAATCKFSGSMGVAYASMPNNFTVTGGTFHSRAISNLTNGNTYNLYVKCMDTQGNTNSLDYLITFNVSNVSADVTPPVLSNGLPTGALAAGTTNTNISAGTNEAATCKYSTTANTSYASMTNTFSTTGGTTHSSPISGLSNGMTYNYYVRCIDTSANANTMDYTISFSINGSDITPPVRSNGNPSGTLFSGTTSAVLNLTTDEAATCKYSTIFNTSYASMPNTFSTTGGISHLTLVSGLSDGQTYNYYVRCRDISLNANTNDFLITFNIASPSTPVISALTVLPSYSYAYVSWNTNVPANASVNYGLAPASLTSSASINSFGLSRGLSMTSLSSVTQYYYRVTSCSPTGLCTQSSVQSFTTTMAQCPDGTPQNTCSAAKPKFCQANLSLVNSCSTCGCPGNYVCGANDTCQSMPTYSQITIAGNLTYNDQARTPCYPCSITLVVQGAVNSTWTNSVGAFSLTVYTTATPGVYPMLISLWNGTQSFNFIRYGVLK